MFTDRETVLLIAQAVHAGHQADALRMLRAHRTAHVGLVLKENARLRNAGAALAPLVPVDDTTAHSLLEWERTVRDDLPEDTVGGR